MKRVFLYAIAAAGVASVFFLEFLIDPSTIYFSAAAAAVAGIGVFFVVLNEGYVSRNTGLYFLVVGILLFVGSFALAYAHNETFIEFVQHNDRFLHRAPFYAVATTVCGLCFIVRSIMTGQWHKKE